MMLIKLTGLDEALYGGKVKPAICEEVGYGGAAYGGKTEGMIGVAIIALCKIPGVKIGYFRRTFKELEGSDGPIERSHVYLPEIGGKYNKSEHSWRIIDASDPKWNEGRAGSLRFCHCQNEIDVKMYQSWSFDILLFDEATQFTWYQYSMLKTRNRVSTFCNIPSPFSIASTNPGGVGHIWYKRQFGIKDRAGQD